MATKIVTITIPGRLPSANEYINDSRGNKYKSAKVKKNLTESIAALIINKSKGVKFKRVFVKFKWIEKDKRRDPDNIAFAKKFILDAAQLAGLIENDGQSQINGFVDEFDFDSDNPRVEVSFYRANNER